MHRLIALAFSHYVEKARWALDRAQIRYREERYMPMFSSLAVAVAVRGRGGQADRVSSRFSSPILLLDDGRVLRSSGQIARYASEQGGLGWYDDPEAAELEAWYHDCLGPHTRRVAYREAFRSPSVLPNLAKRNVSPWQARWFGLLYPAVRGYVARGLAVESKAQQSIDYARKELNTVGERLSDGRPYLVGDRFTAADLSFACMMAPAILPTHEEGFGAHLPRIDELGDEAQSMVREFRDHPAGRFALRMFAEERHAR